MPNISAETLGTGYYLEDDFEEQIYDEGIDQDWWIEDSVYKILIQTLQIIDFETKEPLPWYKVLEIINNNDKDLPANPGVRFPGATGVLGTASYSPVRYVRVSQSVKAHFVALIGLAYHVIFTCRGGGDFNGQVLQHAALIFGDLLGAVATSVVETYSRTKFEREFNLNWIPNIGGDNDSGSSQLGEHFISGCDL